MRINHNIASLNTYNRLAANQTNGNKSLEKLSSGLRINKAGDDAAGLAISEKMRGQISGLNMASKNAQDGISLVQTAEGALNETHSILQRIRELAVQSSSDTNTSADRTVLQQEVTQLASEVGRIGTSTEFNTKSLLNGGAGLATTFSAKTVAGAAADWINVAGGTALTGTGTAITITDAAKAAGATYTATSAATAGAKSVTVNGYTLNYTAVANSTTDAAALVAQISANSATIGATASAAIGVVTITNSSAGSASRLTVGAVTDAFTAATINANNAGTDATITSADLGTSYVASGNTVTYTGGTYNGLSLQINSTVASSTASQNDAVFDITANGTMAVQIGANAGQEMSISISDMRDTALGINGLDISTQASAKAAISTVDTAIRTVSTERSKLGAYQNRLEHTINNLGTSSENLTAAESRIRDVDMAKEMMDFTKNNILSQAATAMLAQANQAPQGILQLLR